MLPLTRRSFVTTLVVASAFGFSGTVTAQAPNPTPAPAPKPAPAPTPAPANAADRIADRVQAFYDKTKTFKASFKQVYTVKAYNKTKEARGSVIFEKPGKMSWRYENNGNRIVSDGKLIKVYEKENKQMYEQPMEKSQYPAALAFLVGQGNLKQSFKLSQLDSKQMNFEGGYVLQGEPREATPGLPANDSVRGRRDVSGAARAAPRRAGQQESFRFRGDAGESPAAGRRVRVHAAARHPGRSTLKREAARHSPLVLRYGVVTTPLGRFRAVTGPRGLLSVELKPDSLAALARRLERAIGTPFVLEARRSRAGAAPDRGVRRGETPPFPDAPRLVARPWFSTARSRRAREGALWTHLVVR